MEIERVSDPSICHGKYHGFTISHEAGMTDEAFIEDIVNRFTFVNASLR
jgi:hypothetical protein